VALAFRLFAFTIGLLSNRSLQILTWLQGYSEVEVPGEEITELMVRTWDLPLHDLWDARVCR